MEKMQDKGELLSTVLCILILMQLIAPVTSPMQLIPISHEFEPMKPVSINKIAQITPSTRDDTFINLRAVAYQPGIAGSWDTNTATLFTDRVRADMQYIKSLGFNAIKLWDDPSPAFWQHALDSFLDITDEMGIYVIIASIPETDVLGWGDKFNATPHNTPTADELGHIAKIASSHDSVLANALHLNDLSVEDGANVNYYWQWIHQSELSSWTLDSNAPLTASFVSKEESLLRIAPKNGSVYNYGWMKNRLSLDLSTWNTISIRIANLENGAKWALKIFDYTTNHLYTLQNDYSHNGIFQYKIPLSDSSQAHDVELQLYAIDGTVTIDWMWISKGLVNLKNGNDSFKQYYRNLVTSIKNNDTKHAVFLFTECDPVWQWVPVSVDYWGSDFQVDAFGLQPYSGVGHLTFDKDTFVRYFRYFGRSQKPMYIDEWGVKDSPIKVDEIHKFIDYMEKRQFESQLTIDEKVIGWTYFMLDNPNNNQYGLRDIKFADDCSNPDGWIPSYGWPNADVSAQTGVDLLTSDGRFYSGMIPPSSSSNHGPIFVKTLPGLYPVSNHLDFSVKIQHNYNFGKMGHAYVTLYDSLQRRVFSVFVIDAWYSTLTRLYVRYYDEDGSAHTRYVSLEGGWTANLRVSYSNGYVRGGIDVTGGLDYNWILAAPHQCELNRQVKYITLSFGDKFSYNYESKYIHNIEIRASKSTAIQNAFKNELQYRAFGWAPLTIPQGHYLTFHKCYENNIHPWYDLTTYGSNDYSYYFMAYTNWNLIHVRGTNDPSPGSIGISGYFKCYDTISPDKKPGRSFVRAYILDASGQTILASAELLSSTNADNKWHHVSITITGLEPGSEVRVGIGRRDAWLADWSLSFGFTYVQIWDGS